MEKNKMVEHNFNGDDHLSGFTRGLWKLAYSCLYKFECPVIFKTMGPDVPHKMGQFIQFFVPAYHENSQEVVKYLQTELAHDERPDQTTDKGEFWYGTHIMVLEYSGLEPYLEHAECQKLAQKFMKSFMEQIKNTDGAN